MTLNFRKVPAALHVPYAALTSFVDKGANFGLQFHSGANSESSEAAGGAKVEVLSQPITDKSAPQATDAAADEPHRDAEVVSLDKFRKK